MLKTLAAMQPYFFPYIGYFSLIDAVDHFVFFDTVQFVRKSWMSRNRIIRPDWKDVQYINIGLEGMTYQVMMKECKLKRDSEWKLKLISQFGHYKTKAPYYKEVINLLQFILEKPFSNIADFNIESILLICDYISLEKKITRSSGELREFRSASHPGEWGLIIASMYNATHYINAPGGVSFYKPQEFKEASIHLGFLQPNIKVYNQNSTAEFKSGLSILDVLMFNSPSEVREMIKSYTLDWKN
jgi:hypothetical protein